MARIRFFAAAEEAAGAAELVRAEASLGALRDALLTERPALADLWARCAVLVDGARSDDDASLGSDTVVDVLPPFAGG